jgi:hypothetical protein
MGWGGVPYTPALTIGARRYAGRFVSRLKIFEKKLRSDLLCRGLLRVYLWQAPRRRQRYLSSARDCRETPVTTILYVLVAIAAIWYSDTHLFLGYPRYFRVIFGTLAGFALAALGGAAIGFLARGMN